MVVNVTPQFDEFYLSEPIPAEPKLYFTAVMDLIAGTNLKPPLSILDIGTANGAFQAYLSDRFDCRRLVGTDIYGEMIAAARANVPEAEFIKCSLLQMPADMSDAFDVTTAFGVIQHFDENELKTGMAEMIRCTRKGGRIYIFSAFNEYGVDVVLRYRMKRGAQPDNWLSGNNIFCFETIEELLRGNVDTWNFIPFEPRLNQQKVDDPRRTWTIKTETNPFQRTNGLKFLTDIYILEIQV